MKFFSIYSLLILTILPLLSCQKSENSTKQIDNNSYITDFELLQENPNNETSVKITSPKAIINQQNNNIDIFDSSIVIATNNEKDLLVRSGNSSINNLSNIINVYNNVKISFLNNENFLIITNAFNWDLKTSVIDINYPLNIIFDNSNIIASNGFYNIDLSLLNIFDTKYNRYIYNSDGKKEYQLEIKSDFAKWFKKDNTLVFTSYENQVETTINFLITE